VHKFTGLAELFPGGCATVALDESGADVALERAIVSAWTQAPDRRDQLLRAARAQIDAGRAAYRQLGQLVSHRLGIEDRCDVSIPGGGARRAEANATGPATTI
jgi:hypothetical protein